MVGELVKKPEHEREPAFVPASQDIELRWCSESIRSYALCVVHWDK